MIRLDMRNIFLALLTVASVIFASTVTARAVITEKDLFSPGDKLLTLDSTTGLEWLDVYETRGLSYNDVAISDIGGFISLGFRHATIDEVLALYGEFGITDLSFGLSAANFLPALDLFDTMSFIVIDPNVPTQRQQGFADLIPLDPLTVHRPEVFVNLADGVARAGIPVGSIVGKGVPFNDMGSYLVRPAALGRRD